MLQVHGNGTLTSEWKTDPKAVGDAFLSAFSFYSMGAPGVSLDWRELGRNVANIIARSPNPQAALDSTRHTVEAYITGRFSTPEDSSAMDMRRDQFMVNVERSIRYQIAKPSRESIVGHFGRLLKRLAGEEHSSATSPQMSRDTLSLGSEYGRRGLESASQFDAHLQSRPSTEEDVLRKAESIVARFGIHSIGIDGDAMLSSPDMMKRLITAEKDLEAACIKLGVEDEGFGTRRKLRVLISNEASFHTSIQGAGGMFSPYASEPVQCEDAVLAYCQGRKAVERISHEYGHNVDFRLCKLALGDAYGDDEHDFFSELPRHLQARLPRAKAALENIFRLLEDDVDAVDRTAERVAAVNNKLVFEVIGRERYLSLSEQDLVQVGTALTWKNDFAICAAQEFQRSDKWKSRTLDGVQHSYRTAVGADAPHQGNLLSTVAHLLNEPRSVIEDRYKRALGILEPEIKALAPHLTQMRRYVSAPGKMLRDSVEKGSEPKFPTLNPYPTQPGEFVAKFTGRPSSLWAIGLAAIGDSSEGHALGKAQVAHLNAQWSEMLREAGIAQRAAGPRLGSSVEMAADTVFRVVADAKYVTVGAAKQTLESAKRLSASVIASMSPRKVQVDRQKKPGM